MQIFILFISALSPFGGSIARLSECTNVYVRTT